MIVFVVLLMLIGGCAKPVMQTSIPMSTYDKDTLLGIEEFEGGFNIAVSYSRYQFIPESDSVAIACKSQLTALAWEYAENKGRKIDSINEQRIKISMGRNGFTGITSCQATVRVKFVEIK